MTVLPNDNLEEILCEMCQKVQDNHSWVRLGGEMESLYPYLEKVRTCVLETYQQELIEKVERLQKDESIRQEPAASSEYGYNQALDDVLAILKDTK